jgi:hypothetical protein
MQEEGTTIFSQVRSSARFVRDNAQHVKINHDAIAAFVQSLDPGTCHHALLARSMVCAWPLCSSR